MCERDVEQKCLESLPFTRRLRKYVERPHYFQSVGELNDGHAGVAGIGDDEPFVVLGFKLCILWLYGGNLVEAVYHRENIGRKARERFHIVAKPVRLMEEHGGDAFGREANLVADYAGDVDRMLNERMPISAELSYKVGLRNFPRPRYQGASLVGVFSEQFINFFSINHNLCSILK